MPVINGERLCELFVASHGDCQGQVPKDLQLRPAPDFEYSKVPAVRSFVAPNRPLIIGYLTEWYETMPEKRCTFILHHIITSHPKAAHGILNVWSQFFRMTDHDGGLESVECPHHCMFRDVYPTRCFKECTEIAGLDDAAEFTAVLECMSVLVDRADRATGDFERFPHYKWSSAMT